MPVNNVNFLDVNLVTTLFFLTLSIEYDVFFFTGSELHVPAKL